MERNKPAGLATHRSALLSEAEAAAFLNLRPNTLAHWRMTKLQPLPYIRIGRSIRYRMEDLLLYIENRRVDGNGGTR